MVPVPHKPFTYKLLFSTYLVHLEISSVPINRVGMKC